MKREAQRKQLLEMKRQRREQLAAAKNQAACDDEATIGDSVNIAVKNSSDTIGDTVNIAVKNSS